ncbi:uncharacterized protein SPSK_10206 [Sporothrix schenckii 1099-18]|uniref:Uncharacterized protein n=1 Tax=Sporothrix schenckii 1099-18 TaxID=1397361 RepID=A0A0F2M7H1_SPOSC|nr:uncharacterized protein SPSK_10206 [Sporothrix schenckii 1099-18]KJR84775.1 hypothetical protein SPSK_10206 [Sporothrix schenckii 1099-18]
MPDSSPAAQIEVTRRENAQNSTETGAYGRPKHGDRGEGRRIGHPRRSHVMGPKLGVHPMQEQLQKHARLRKKM